MCLPRCWSSRADWHSSPVRLVTRGGYDWTKRYPWIVEAARKNRQKWFVIDGEAVILGVDGISDFNALHSGRHNKEVQLCAFDILVERAPEATGEFARGHVIARGGVAVFAADVTTAVSLLGRADEVIDRGVTSPQRRLKNRAAAFLLCRGKYPIETITVRSALGPYDHDRSAIKKSGTRFVALNIQ